MTIRDTAEGWALLMAAGLVASKAGPLAGLVALVALMVAWEIPAPGRARR